MKISLVLGWFLVLSLAAVCSQSNAADEKTESSSAAETAERTKPPASSEKGIAEGEPAPGTNPSSKKNEALTPEEVISETSLQLDTRVPFSLPAAIPLDKDKHLTSLATSDAKTYEIAFYQTSKPISINSSKLRNLGNESKIAVIKAAEYESEEKAAEQIGYQKAEPAGNPPVDLGHGITGYTDAGAGSAFLHWNEGRWSFMSKARNESGEDANKELGRKVVDYLEKEMLPPPDQGTVLLDGNDAGSRNHYTAWQEGNIVYEIVEADGAMTMLEVAAAFNKD
ncbi:hypothetical protein [Metabacillus sp. 84]|uniref:hypothetical protein n=1 Tax=Metabacillus sp. 84 TaxID=3404705 RepID=UPI003CEC8429